MIKNLKLYELKIGHVIKVTIAPFLRHQTSNGCQWFLTNLKENWHGKLIDQTLTIISVIRSDAYYILKTVEFGNIATWVDNVKHVKCFTAKNESKK